MEHDIEINFTKLKPINLITEIGFIPNCFDNETIEKIKAVAVARFTGLSSVDYTYKKYTKNTIENNKKEQDFEVLLSEITNIIDKHRIKNYERIRKINFSIKGETATSFGVEAALTRLNNTYEISIFLLRNGFTFEAFTLIRQIFEQLTYVMNICDLSNNEYENIFNSKNAIKKKLSPTNINKFSTTFPELGLGKFYRFLSSKAHIDISNLNHYITIDVEAKFTIRSKKKALVPAYILLKVVYINAIVLEYALRKHISKEEYMYVKEINEDDNTVILQADNELKEKLIILRAEIKKYIK